MLTERERELQTYATQLVDTLKRLDNERTFVNLSLLCSDTLLVRIASDDVREIALTEYGKKQLSLRA